MSIVQHTVAADRRTCAGCGLELTPAHIPRLLRWVPGSHVIFIVREDGSEVAHNGDMPAGGTVCDETVPVPTPDPDPVP